MSVTSEGPSPFFGATPAEWRHFTEHPNRCSVSWRYGAGFAEDSYIRFWASQRRIPSIVLLAMSDVFLFAFAVLYGFVWWWVFAGMALVLLVLYVTMTVVQPHFIYQRLLGIPLEGGENPNVTAADTIGSDLKSERWDPNDEVDARSSSTSMDGHPSLLQRLIVARIVEFVTVATVLSGTGMGAVFFEAAEAGCIEEPYPSGEAPTVEHWCYYRLMYMMPMAPLQVLRPRLCFGLPAALIQIVVFAMVGLMDAPLGLLPVALQQMMNVFLVAGAVISVAGGERSERRRFEALAAAHSAQLEVRRHQAAIDAITHAAVPPQCVARIQAAPSLSSVTLCDTAPIATVAVVGVVGFDHWSTGLLPAHVVLVLHRMFTQFDRRAGSINVTRATTFGDSYVVVAGLWGDDTTEDHTRPLCGLSGAGDAGGEGHERNPAVVFTPESTLSDEETTQAALSTAAARRSPPHRALRFCHWAVHTLTAANKAALNEWASHRPPPSQAYHDDHRSVTSLSPRSVSEGPSTPDTIGPVVSAGAEVIVPVSLEHLDVHGSGHRSGHGSGSASDEDDGEYAEGSITIPAPPPADRFRAPRAVQRQHAQVQGPMWAQRSCVRAQTALSADVPICAGVGTGRLAGYVDGRTGSLRFNVAGPAFDRARRLRDAATAEAVSVDEATRDVVAVANALIAVSSKAAVPQPLCPNELSSSSIGADGNAVTVPSWSDVVAALRRSPPPSVAAEFTAGAACVHGPAHCKESFDVAGPVAVGAAAQPAWATALLRHTLTHELDPLWLTLSDPDAERRAVEFSKGDEAALTGSVAAVPLLTAIGCIAVVCVERTTADRVRSFTVAGDVPSLLLFTAAAVLAGTRIVLHVVPRVHPWLPGDLCLAAASSVSLGAGLGFLDDSILTTTMTWAAAAMGWLQFPFPQLWRWWVTALLHIAVNVLPFIVAHGARTAWFRPVDIEAVVVLFLGVVITWPYHYINRRAVREQFQAHAVAEVLQIATAQRAATTEQMLAALLPPHMVGPEVDRRRAVHPSALSHAVPQRPEHHSQIAVVVGTVAAVGQCSSIAAAKVWAAVAAAVRGCGPDALLSITDTYGDSFTIAGPLTDAGEPWVAAAEAVRTVRGLAHALLKMRCPDGGGAPCLTAGLAAGSAYSALLGDRLLTHRLFGVAVREASVVARCCPDPAVSHRLRLAAMSAAATAASSRASFTSASHERSPLPLPESVAFAATSFRRLFRTAAVERTAHLPPPSGSGSGMGFSRAMWLSASQLERSGYNDLRKQALDALALDLPDDTFAAATRWRTRAAGVIMASELLGMPRHDVPGALTIPPLKSWTTAKAPHHR